MGAAPSLSTASSSGVSGDTSSGPIADYYFASPFNVGKGSATTAQAGANSLSTPVLIIGGIAAVFGLIFALRQ